jgi:3-methylcrotonyl-CoA carboxylase alpha subunit
MIKRLLVANRGEIAVRIIRACRELEIESVAVYSEVDAKARHVAAADHAVAIGPAPAAESYLSIPRLLEAARSTGADAVHPGYGFLSENATFAEACLNAGLIFVGPPPAVIAQMGSKIDARRLVAAAGVPVVPGETPEDQSDSSLRQAVERVGLPALIKASAGGGGKGMRKIPEGGEIDASIQAARREAAAAFGDGTLYVERLVEQARHVEVQIFGDADGHVVHLFDRDCSMQRRHQKVIEESPSPALTTHLRARITQAAVAAARAAQYRNAGTVEFLVDVTGGSQKSGPANDIPFYFLEMNTRLQVEHAVTEQVTGLDLVRAQLLVAGGQPLPWRQDDIIQRGHAIEARVYAENPAQGFLPQAGRLLAYREPRWPGVRVDSGVAEGDEVSIYYDPMIAKVIAAAETRDLAIARLTAALREFSIEGVRTNLPFLVHLLELPEVRAGAIDTGFLDREGARIAEQSAIGSPPSAVESAIRNRQSAIHNPQPELSRAGYDPWDPPSLAGAAARASSRPAAPTMRRSAASISGALTAPMPATVIRVEVKPGDAVKKGDIVVVLEAMKMELQVRALGDAVVAAVCCREGELVQADATLVEFT